MKLSTAVFATVCAFFAAGMCRPVAAETASEDPYVNYIKNSKDFKPIKQDKDWCYKAWPSWTYMPWYYQWTIGYGEEAGKFCQETGYNGAFTDRGNPEHLDFFNKYKLRFYVDHTAGKGDLYIHVKNKMTAQELSKPRSPQIDSAMAARLKSTITSSINGVKSSPMRSAYALDDEISWGSFVKPCMWRITGDAEYRKWLEEVYGAGKAPKHEGWISYDAIRTKLAGWTIGAFDASQLMDQWSFNDSYWANFLGELVEHANTVDPATPVGFVGGQSPNAFGGYDYVKLMRKIQFIEAYNVGGAQAVIRSFNPKNALPAVTTHFYSSSMDCIWQAYYYVAHGNRGHIGWVEKWFNGKTPRPWQKEVAPAYLEAGQKLGPLQSQSEWKHDGVAIYYSQASIQLGWILDAASHKGTWPNRNDDASLGAAANLRHAWENMLRDEGFQYNFISYADVIAHGIPSEYKVLILPAALCLSNAEAARIKDFCKAGGTVIADYLPGCWDQHGKGRAGGGVLDDMFGVKHNPGLKAADVFQGGNGWYEINQDANFFYKNYNSFLTNANTCIKDPLGFHKAVRAMEVNKANKYGAGQAVLMNLSPQWYNAYRESGFEPAKKREVFMQHIKNAGLKRWVEIQGAGEKEFTYEITYWQKNGRTLVFVVSNPETRGNSLGGGNSVGLKSDEVEIALKFAKPISGVKDERAGTALANGDTFKFKWKMSEAVVLSFDTPK